MLISLETIHSDDLFITQSRVRDVFAEDGAVEYEKKEFLLAGGEWQGNPVLPLRSRNPEASVLVLGESDKLMTWLEIQRIFAVGRYRKIWATHHRNSFGSRVRTLPLGLPMDRHYGGPFKVLGNIDQVRSIFAKVPSPNPDSAKILGAFSWKTHRSRPPLAAFLKASPIGTVGDYPVTPSGRAAYLQKIKESGMVACPPGRGIDTYRFWETIYMGAVPVIASPPKAYAQCIEGLPFIAVKNWSQLADISWVRSEYSRVRNSRWDFSRASLDWVVEEIRRL